MKMKKIIIISGPTASGKSSLALDISAFKDIEIINADALQLYEGLPILSAQPSEEEKKLVKHHLYSYFKSEEICSVGSWLKLVKSTIEDVFRRDKTPLIVGGTGMYISKLIDGINEIPEIDEINKINARELYKKIEHHEFIDNLIAISGESDLMNRKIRNLDKQRLIRAYEVFLQTKKSIFWWQNQENKSIFDPKLFLHINLNLDREKLYQNCDLRFEKMLENGALLEVESLMKKPIKVDAQIKKTIGYIEISDYLNKKISYQQVIELAAKKTRNYAKRQLTWFRNQFDNCNIFDNKNAALKFLKDEI